MLHSQNVDLQSDELGRDVYKETKSPKTNIFLWFFYVDLYQYFTYRCYEIHLIQWVLPNLTTSH